MFPVHLHNSSIARVQISGQSLLIFVEFQTVCERFRGNDADFFQSTTAILGLQRVTQLSTLADIVQKSGRNSAHFG